MRLLNIICESMLMEDVTSQIKGFKLIPFDTTGAKFSAQSLWRMNTDLPQPTVPKNIWEGKSFLEDIPDPLMSHYKVRIISNFWPNVFDPKCFDPDCADKAHKTVATEPENHQWKTFLQYLNGPRLHDWVIYWPTIGHMGYRKGTENTGIPEHIRTTTTAWLEMVQQDILPVVTESTVLIHTDHGSRRTNQTEEEFNRGFAYVPENMQVEKLDWTSFRGLVQKILC